MSPTTAALHWAQPPPRHGVSTERNWNQHQPPLIGLAQNNAFWFSLHLCNINIFFWICNNIFAVVSNSGLCSAGAGAGVWRAERRVRTSVTTFSVTNGQGIPNEASPRRHNYTLHQPEIRHVSDGRQNTRWRSRFAFVSFLYFNQIGLFVCKMQVIANHTLLACLEISRTPTTLTTSLNQTAAICSLFAVTSWALDNIFLIPR